MPVPNIDELKKQIANHRQTLDWLESVVKIIEGAGSPFFDITGTREDPRVWYGDPHPDEDKIWVVPPGFVPQATVDARNEEIKRLKDDVLSANKRGDRYLDQVRALNNRMSSIRNITQYDEPAGKVPHAGA